MCLVAAMVTVGLLSGCDKGAPKPPEERLVYGKAVVEKAPDGTIKSIRLETRKRGRVYHITLDEKGKQLAEMGDKSLAVKGTYIGRKGEDRWLTVIEAVDEETFRANKKKAAEERKAAEEKAAGEKKAPTDKKAPADEKPAAKEQPAEPKEAPAPAPK